MIIVRIQGGLGNQMFEYAFALWQMQQSKEVKIDTSLYSKGSKNSQSDEIHNGFELKRIFDIKFEEASQLEINRLSSYKPGFVSKIKRRLFGLKSSHIKNAQTKDKRWYNPSLIKIDNAYFDGYWCSFLYANEIRDKVRNTFDFKPSLSGKNEEVKNQIQSNESVSLHIRRGDYLNLSDRYSILSVNYYRNAIEYINQKVNNPLFFIFSDDIAWCKQQFSDVNTCFIDWNQGNDSYIDMQLMSLCKHNIVANSTFSMWAAWLNDNEKKIVIRPSRVFVDSSNEYLDMWPDDWIALDN